MAKKGSVGSLIASENGHLVSVWELLSQYFLEPPYATIKACGKWIINNVVLF